MGYSFKVNFNRCEASGGQLRSMGQKLEQSSSQITAIISRLDAAMSYQFVQHRLRNVHEQLNRSASSCKTMSSILTDSIARYKKAEQTLQQPWNDTAMNAVAETIKGKYLDDGGFWNWVRNFFGWGDPFTEDEIDSIVFDDDGSYGGDQGSPQNTWGFWSNKDELYDTVRDYYPDMSDKEIKQYLQKLNSEGCGYVAVANTIFAAFEGRADEFRETFGFDMYASNSDLNYNQLIVDFYAATDNHQYRNGADTINPNEDFDATTGSGMTPQEQRYRTLMYLNRRGVPISIDLNEDVTVQNFSDISRDHYVSIAFYDGNLQNEDGSVAQYIDGGHSMLITGTTSDGRFIVSSWGEKYYIDPNEIVDGKTRYIFTTYKYE